MSELFRRYYTLGTNFLRQLGLAGEGGESKGYRENGSTK